MVYDSFSFRVYIDHSRALKHENEKETFIFKSLGVDFLSLAENHDLVKLIGKFWRNSPNVEFRKLQTVILYWMRFLSELICDIFAKTWSLLFQNPTVLLAKIGMEGVGTLESKKFITSP